MSQKQTKIKSGKPRRLTQDETEILLQAIRLKPEFALACLEKGTDPNLSLNDVYPIHMAIKYGRMDVLEALLETGAKPDVKTNKGYTPLMFAVNKNNMAAVEMLLDNRADITKTDKEGRSILHFTRNPKMIDYLLDNGVDINATDMMVGTLLHHAVLEKNSKLVAHLIEKGAHVNETGKDKLTPLHLAKDKEMARILVEAGADLNAREAFTKETPLHKAIMSKNEALAEYLVEMGSRLDAETDHEEMPLEVALKHGTPKMVEMLIRAGADTSITGAKDRASLFTMASDPKMIDILAVEGLKINHQDKYGMTALHLVSDPKIAEALLNRRADINIEDKMGNTPLLLALKGGRYEVAELLIEKGAKVGKSDQYGVSPWEYVRKELKRDNLSDKERQKLTKLQQQMKEKSAWYERLLAQNEDKGSDAKSLDSANEKEAIKQDAGQKTPTALAQNESVSQGASAVLAQDGHGQNITQATRPTVTPAKDRGMA